MQFAVDYDDYTSILAYVFHLSRRLEPILRDELPALLGRRKPSGLARVADAAGRGRLHRRDYPRQMLPVIVDACSMAIDDGTGTSGDWVEMGWSDGGIDWGWREITTYTDEARQLMPLRTKIAAGVWPIDAFALVWLAVGLPRLGQRWSSIARAALDVDVEALPQITVVPAHVSLRIRKEFRAEGHELG